MHGFYRIYNSNKTVHTACCCTFASFGLFGMLFVYHAIHVATSRCGEHDTYVYVSQLATFPANIIRMNVVAVAVASPHVVCMCYTATERIASTPVS